MALTDRLMDEVRVKLPGAVDPLIKSELWDTLNDACRQGFIWREEVAVTLVVNENAYTVAPTGTDVVYLFGVGHATLNTDNAVFQYGTLTLIMPPAAGDITSPLFADCCLTPALDPGTDIEAWIPADMWSEHHAMIRDGVLGRMMAQLAKPYSNPQLAAFYMRSYLQARAQARQKVRTGGRIGVQVWRFPAFGGGTGRLGARR